MDNLKNNEDNKYEADSSTRYEMRRCVENESREQVIRRLKRAALPMALLASVIIVAWILK